MIGLRIEEPSLYLGTFSVFPILSSCRAIMSYAFLDVHGIPLQREVSTNSTWHLSMHT